MKSWIAVVYIFELLLPIRPRIKMYFIKIKMCPAMLVMIVSQFYYRMVVEE